MSSKLEIKGEVAEVFSEKMMDWFYDSGLAGDWQTIKVVELVERACSESGDNIDVRMARPASFLHRAREVASDIEDFGDIPGLGAGIDLSVLRGFSTKAALIEHCSGSEERIGAVVLNMAVQWARGKNAYKWAWDVVAEYAEQTGDYQVFRGLQRIEDNGT